MLQPEASTASELVEWALAEYGHDFAIATAFQKEGMVIIDMAARSGQPFRVFTLDTGRLPEETDWMINTVQERYGITVERVSPDPAEVARMVSERGPDLFYESVEGRRLCCEVRRVRPMERKLRELKAWAAGLRWEQTEQRASVRKLDVIEGRVKICPLADWSSFDVESYLREHDVPVHPLYSRGFTSIGCAPCTRAVSPGEPERAGRWWWENNVAKECGIHFTADGKVRRA